MLLSICAIELHDLTLRQRGGHSVIIAHVKVACHAEIAQFDDELVFEEAIARRNVSMYHIAVVEVAQGAADLRQTFVPFVIEHIHLSSNVQKTCSGQLDNVIFDARIVTSVIGDEREKVRKTNLRYVTRSPPSINSNISENLRSIIETP